MDTKPSPQNPNPNSTTMAFHFIKALANIQQTSHAGGGRSRSRRINRAAYASMAIAAGPRRAWSQALLQRLRSRRSLPHHQRVLVIRRRKARVSGMPNRRVESLRRLVPGGKGMDFCCLLEETASFVQSLRDQVTLMQTIVDSAS